MSQPDVMVVGGGPAGMSAALAAAETGLRCRLVDEGFAPGGQFHRLVAAALGAADPDPAGAALRARLSAASDRIDVCTDTAVWGVWGGPRVALDRDGAHEVVEPGVLVLAPGAYEYAPPFPGWTTPGVLTPGAAQILVKAHGIAPGRRVALAGSGPFLLAVAAQLVARGVDVACVLEAASLRDWSAVARAGWRTPGVLAEGFRYLAALRRARVPVRYGRAVVAALGEEGVTSIVHAPVDAEWRPDRGRLCSEEVDTLCVGFGFVPRVFLAQLAGCEVEHRADAGGWVPVRDRDLATSVPNVLTAGDGARVGGARVAVLEGRLAGLSAARRLGALRPAAYHRERDRLESALGRLEPLRAALSRVSQPRRGLHDLVQDDTIVCRCEEVAWGDVRRAVRCGGTRYATLKVMTRVGMGPCQGRVCWPALSRQVARERGVGVEQVGCLRVRPPVRPVYLGALAGEAP